jgi:hypothetical protein
MALRPVRGEPGKFIDTVTNVEYDISEMREDDKYDTVFIAAGAVAPGTTFLFFRDLAGKFLIDTNLNLQARISHGEEMIIDRVGMQTRSATGNLEPTPSDHKKVLDDAFYRLEINRLLYIEGPLIKMPSGYGVYGNSVAAGQGVVSNGVPSTAAASRLSQTQLLTSDHEFVGTMTFFDRAWTGLTLADRMPTLATGVLVTCYLHGLIKAATSK